MNDWTAMAMQTTSLDDALYYFADAWGCSVTWLGRVASRARLAGVEDVPAWMAQLGLAGVREWDDVNRSSVIQERP